MFWPAVFVFVFGPMSVLTLPTTPEGYTYPLTMTNPTQPSVPLPPGELELILDTLLTQVDRHNTWLETLQGDVNNLGDSVEIQSLDIQKLKKDFDEVKNGKKSSKQSSKDSLESEDNLIDSLSLEDLSWGKSGSKSSDDSSNGLYDEEDWGLFRKNSDKFSEKHGSTGHKGENKDNKDTEVNENESEKDSEEEVEEEEEEEEESEQPRRHGNWWHSNRWRGNNRRDDSHSTEGSSSEEGHNRRRGLMGDYRRGNEDNTEERSSEEGYDAHMESNEEQSWEEEDSISQESHNHQESNSHSNNEEDSEEFGEEYKK